MVSFNTLCRRCVAVWFRAIFLRRLTSTSAVPPVTNPPVGIKPSSGQIKPCVAIHNGFKIEGVNRLSFMQKNKLLDQTMVGITRNEIVGLLR